MSSRREKKLVFFEKLRRYVDEYPQCLIVGADNVGSKQLASIRQALRGKAIVLMGKNTTIRTCLKGLIKDNPKVEKLMSLIKLNVGFVFCKDDPAEVREIILKNKVPAPAKVGVVAPCDVWIPAGSTGMDAGSTSFFQALGIATKIVKLQIEIISDVQVITGGEKVSASASTLLQKLNRKPFEYGLQVQSIYDNGTVYDASVLDITDEDIRNKVKDAVKYVASLSREVGFPTAASVPHGLVEAFKFATALVLDSDYTFPEMASLKA